MKAKVVKTGDVIDVSLMTEEMYRDTSTSGIDEKVYYKSELEFLPDTHEEVTIDGWVAVDEWGIGGLFLHVQKPHAESREFCDTGEYEIVWESNGRKYELDSKLFPDMTPESEPKKYKITITPME